jgi:hypothetical protein
MRSNKEIERFQLHSQAENALTQLRADRALSVNDLVQELLNLTPQRIGILRQVNRGGQYRASRIAGLPGRGGYADNAR